MLERQAPASSRTSLAMVLFCDLPRFACAALPTIFLTLLRLHQ